MATAKGPFASSLIATLRAEKFVDAELPDRPTPARHPFVTISRQAGAGGHTLAAALVAALNAKEEAAGTQADRWHTWDHELVEKVAAEQGLPEGSVEAMEDAEHPWLGEVIGSLEPSLHPDEFKVYRRVAATIRAIASRGRAVIVGRGGVFLTEILACGLHVDLVAPLQYRVAHMAERLNVSETDAAKRVAEIDRNRAAFYRRHWPGRRVSPETFAITFNAAALSAEQMTACLVPLVDSIERIREPTSAAARPAERAAGV